MKLLDSNEIRQLRDVCIFEENGVEVYMWISKKLHISIEIFGGLQSYP